MVSQIQTILDDVAQAADINPFDIGSGPLQELLFGLKWTTNTTTAIAIAAGLGQWTNIRVFSNGLKTEIPAKDLLAYNILALANVPLNLDAAATSNYVGRVDGLRLPLNLPASVKAQLQMTYTAAATSASNSVNVSAKYKDTLPTGLQGIRKIPIVPTVTAAFGNRATLSYAGAKISGMLLFSTTVPATTADTTSLRKLRLLTGNKVQQEIQWHNLPAIDQAQTGVAAIDAILKTYRWVNFDEPIDATDLIADVYADDTNAVAIEPVYIYG